MMTVCSWQTTFTLSNKCLSIKYLQWYMNMYKKGEQFSSVTVCEFHNILLFRQYVRSEVMVGDDGTYGAVYGCTGRRPKCTKGHFKQHDLFMYHISREWNCLPSNKIYTTALYKYGVLSSMFQNYNHPLILLFIPLLPLNLLFGTLILLEDYQIQILENLWCTIVRGGQKGLKY